MSDLVKSPAETESRQVARPTDPIAALRDDVDRMFQSLWRGSPLTGLDWPRTATTGWAAPAVEFSETDKAYVVTAELPGLDKSDVDISLQGDMLILSGEKRSEHDDKRENVHLSERRYGRFQRAFTLPDDVDASKIEAEFRNGLLHISLPRHPEKRASKTIKIK
ncbi:Hsp20/alpha crystallin family protein [Maricaulis sp.]|uniref:Hsp20/alpha crystallin family protein n=1 Tax=Maricaulis sp. TaxID=1486257 RepID=UPI0026354EF8|nr:Hsp20/alpha crystallin family protein [Maricaulis sp.]